MIKYVLVFTALLTTQLVKAQEKLIVEYEMLTKMDMENIQTFSDGEISDKEWETALKEAMAKPNYYKLILTPEESIFEYIEKVNNTQNEEQGRVMISFGSKGNYYKNILEKITLKETNNWNIDYLIKDSLQNFDWKITKETQEILGYETRKATAVLDSTKTVTAWYAPKLAFKNGPDKFDGLPGLILKAEQTVQNQNGNNQTQTYTAISINVGDQKTKIERPKKGKKVTKEEFEIEHKELMEKMKEMYGGGVNKD